MKYVLMDLETELISGPLDLDLRVPGITIGATLTGPVHSVWPGQLFHRQSPH